MAVRQANRLLQHLRRVVRRPKTEALRDEELLQLFLRQQDQGAFAVLVQRHGPMVLGVCRRVLHNRDDAEDAFQATFLVLVRKAASVRTPRLLGNWLYGVAYRTALHARKAAARRRLREQQASQMTPTPTRAADWDELQAILDEALSTLADHYRAALVLCDLEGKTRKEAARQLGCSEGTVASRLARARGLLARRLRRRGLACTAGVVAGLVAAPAATVAVPPALLHSTVAAAAVVSAGAASAGAISGSVLILMEGVVQSMFLAQIKTWAAVAFALVVLGSGAGMAGYPTWAAEPRDEPAKTSVTSKPSELEKLRRENERLRRENTVLRRQLTAEQESHLRTQLDLEERKNAVQELQAANQALRKQSEAQRTTVRLKEMALETDLLLGVEALRQVPVKQPLALEAKVVEVEKSGLVTIDIGTDKGVQKGQELEIYRVKPTPSYLGRVRILDVHPKEAVGRRLPRQPELEIKPGDKVTDRIPATSAPK